MNNFFKQIVLAITAVGLCCSLAACGAAVESKGKAADTQTQIMAPKDVFYTTNGSASSDVLYDAAPEMYTEKESAASGGSHVYRDHNVKLIRRASLTVQTTEFDRTVAALEQLVIQLEGYYEHAELRGGNYFDQQSNRTGSYTIRIPAQRYDQFIQQVDGIGYLVRKNESTEDVGQAYYDIETRLKTQRTKQERLLELLKNAGSMEDIIAIEHALTEVEYHIEQFTTDLNRYDGLVSYATIQLSLEEMVRIVDEPGEKAGLLARMKAGVISSADGLVSGIQNLVVWFAYNLFTLLFLAMVVTGGIVVVRRYIRRKQLAQQTSEQRTDE